MKRSFAITLHILSTISSLFSQSHFITAGQTSGMIFTDYIPDHRINIGGCSQPCTISGSVNIDINRDGIDDFRVYSAKSYVSHYTNFTCTLISVDGNRVLTKLVNVLCSPDSCSQQVRVAKKFLPGDTLIDSTDPAWLLSPIIIENYSGPTVSQVKTDYLTPVGDPYYYFLKIITANDTLLGYLHFLTISDGMLFDFACEGPTSSYTISSTNDLSSSKVIVYPNPFNAQINVSGERPFQYLITDYLGRVFLFGSSDGIIHTEALMSGSYFLTIKNEEIFSVKKLLKLYPH